MTFVSTNCVLVCEKTIQRIFKTMGDIICPLNQDIKKYKTNKYKGKLRENTNKI